MAASSSVRNTSGCLQPRRTQLGDEDGDAERDRRGDDSARTDEYSVPQMNGSAPNSPAIGSQVSVRQKSSPNFSIDSIDCRDSSKPIATTISTSASAKTPVAIRNPGSPVVPSGQTCPALHPAALLPALLPYPP